MERDNLMHGARTALNQNSEMREWCENYLKEKEKENHPEMSDEEFQKHWRYRRRNYARGRGGISSSVENKMRNER